MIEQVGLYSGEYLVRISSVLPDILTEILRGFPQFLQANARVLLQRSYEHLLPNVYVLNVSTILFCATVLQLVSFKFKTKLQNSHVPRGLSLIQ